MPSPVRIVVKFRREAERADSILRLRAPQHQTNKVICFDCIQCDSFLPSVDSGETTALITGGTIAMAAPLADYVIHVLCPNLRAFGVHLKCRVIKEGFFPRGGGEIALSCSKDDSLECIPDGKVVLRSITLLGRGPIVSVRGRAVIAGTTEDKYGVEMVLSAKRILRRRLQREANYSGDVDIELDRIPPQNCVKGTVAAMTLWATAEGSESSPQTVFGASELRERKLGPKSVAESVANDLCDTLVSGASVDSHMADQLALFLAMAKGESRVCISEPSLHTTTVVKVLQQFGIDCAIHELPNTGLYELRCVGHGVALER